MTVGNIQQVSIANMPQNLQGLDPETMLMAISAERNQRLDEVVKGQAAEMSARNKDMQELNQALQTLRSERPGNADSEDWASKNYSDADSQAIKAAMATLTEHGIKLPDGMKSWNGSSEGTSTNGAWSLKGKQANWDVLIENVKTEIDSLSSNSQLDMIKLQGAINKQNQNMEMMTNLLQKFSKVNDTIIGNMR